MGYRMRFVSQAEQQLNDCCETYGQTFRASAYGQLHEIAQRAAQQDDSQSVNVLEVLEHLIDDPKLATVLRRWRQASYTDKIKAILLTVKNRKPPWRFRYETVTATWLGDGQWPFDVYYLIDDVKRTVWIVNFDGLPGSG